MSDRDRELSPRIAPDTRHHDEQDPEHAASTSQAAPAEDPLTATTPAFEPLFTLLTNTTTKTTVHPRVHYLFSDDDPSILPAPVTPDPSHRALVVDLAHDATATATGGWSVAWASSLSPDFAVAESSISVVQQGDRDDGSIMLKIDGVEREPVNTRSSNTGEGGGSPSNSGASGTVGKEDVDILVDDFRRRMGVLRRVVGQGDKRRQVLDQQHQVEDSEGRQEHSPEHPADTGDAQAQAQARAEPQDSETKAADESQQVKPDA